LLQHVCGIGQELPGDGVVLGLLLAHGPEALGVEEQDPGARIGHEDRRVGGDDELRLLLGVGDSAGSGSSRM